MSLLPTLNTVSPVFLLQTFSKYLLVWLCLFCLDLIGYNFMFWETYILYDTKKNSWGKKRRVSLSQTASLKHIKNRDSEKAFCHEPDHKYFLLVTCTFTWNVMKNKFAKIPDLQALTKKRCLWTLDLKIQNIICNQANNQEKRNTVFKSYTESGYTA